MYICKTCEPVSVKCHNINVQFFGCFKTIAGLIYNLSIELNSYAQHLDKYCKLPLDMQRPRVSNELRKQRYATCKGRKSIMDM